MVTIIDIAPGSIGDELELQPGDALVAIDGKPVRDLLDYVLMTRGAQELLLDVRRADGEEWELELEKDADDDLGIEVEHPDPAQCGNNCLFCFVHQLPNGMRPTLYVKDEDFRFSFLYGAYVTLTNIREEEIERILEQRLSPLYVSVHSTQEWLRAQLLGRDNIPPILKLLHRLADGGIEIHTQVVVCPGLNDGEALKKTIADLAGLAPGIRTLALVPVGLTAYRDQLPSLRPHTVAEARSILALVGRCQQEFLQRFGSRFVFAADEYYLQAELPFPPLVEYEGLPQYENGIGMIPHFRHEAELTLAEATPLPAVTVDCFTGVSFYPDLLDFAQKLENKTGVTIKVHKIDNRFFGGQVTVTGLLTGQDIVTALQGQLSGKILLVPDVVLREGEEVFLDDMTLDELADALDVEILPVTPTPCGLLSALEAIADELY